MFSLRSSKKKKKNQKNGPPAKAEKQLRQGIKTRPVQVSLDLVEAGIVYGWAAEIGNPTPVEIEIIWKHQVIGRGLANRFRSDLADAGINDGYHGFAIDIEEVGALGDQLELSARATAPDLQAQKNSFAFIADRIEGQVLWQRDNIIRLRLAGRDDRDSVSLALYADREQIDQQTIPLSSESQDHSLELPDWLAHHRKSLIRIGARGVAYKTALARPFNAKPITSTAHLYHTLQQAPASPVRSMINSERIGSLLSQYALLKEDAAQLEGEQIAKAHRILCEDFAAQTADERLSFTLQPHHHFSLPNPGQSPDVSIIVPAYNNAALTLHCLASIALSPNRARYEVILADDASTDAVRDFGDAISNLRVVRGDKNLGFLRNCNRAAEIAHGRYLVFLNNDTEVCAGWLDALMAIFDTRPEAGLVGSLLLEPDGRVQDAGGIVWSTGEAWNVGRGRPSDHPEVSYVRETDYVSGAAMMIDRDLWSEVGGFDDAFAPAYFEDTDLAFKVRATGRKVFFTPFAKIFHREGSSHGTDTGEGLKAHQVTNQKTFAKKWAAEFEENMPGGAAAERRAKDRGIIGRILMLDDQLPRPDRDAGSYAAIQEIKMLQAHGYKVTFAPKTLAFLEGYGAQLQSMGVELLYSPYYLGLQDILERRLDEFDAVYITRFEVAELVVDHIKARSRIPILYNNADLHFLREMRSAALTPENQELACKAEQTKARELAVCQKVDVVMCYTAAEHHILEANGIPADKCHITPWILQQRDQGPDFDNRSGIAFLGGYRHKPNIEALDYILGTLAPALGAVRPDITIHIYGSSLPERYKDKASNQVDIIGYAPDLDTPYHAHRLFLAPLLSGAGIKGKVLDALAYGLPCVLSSIAAEGTGIIHQRSGMIADTVESQVAAIMTLYDDGAMWNAHREAALSLANARYTEGAGVRQMGSILGAAGLSNIT